MARPLKRRPKIVYRKLNRRHAYGQHYGHGLIEIDPRLRPKTALTALIHELLHEYFPKASEPTIRRVAYKMSAIMWQQNVRRVIQ
jgi:hypothetical protein